MSCFFCSSNNHVTHNCDIYKFDEQREEFLRQRKLCFNCLAPFKKAVSIFYNDPNCLRKRKCFICFSRSHHTVFCPDRITVLNFFPPNVDSDLIPCFLRFLTGEERYLLCLSSPDNFKSANLQRFKVSYKEEISSSDIKNIWNIHSDFFAADTARIENNLREFSFFYNHKVIPQGSIGLSKLMHISFRIRRIEMFCTSFLSAEFLQLLSRKTRILICGEVEFLQKLIFQEILLKSPFLEEIDIRYTNVKVDNSWLDNLIHFNQAPKLKDVSLKVSKAFTFNVENLASFLMKNRYANISLFTELPEDKDFKKKITKKLSTHFVPYNFSFSSLTIYIVDKCFNVIYSMKYELKDF